MKTLLYLIVLTVIGAALYLHFSNQQKEEEFSLNQNAIIIDKSSDQTIGAIVNFPDGQYIVSNQLLLPEIYNNKRTFVTAKGAKVTINTESIDISAALDYVRLKFSTDSPKFDKEAVFDLLEPQNTYDLKYYICGNELSSKIRNFEPGYANSASHNFISLSKKHNIRTIGSIIVSQQGEFIAIGTSSSPTAYVLADYNLSIDNTTTRRVPNTSTYKNLGAIVSKNSEWITKDGNSYVKELKSIISWAALVTLCKELYDFDKTKLREFSQNSLVKYLSKHLDSSRSQELSFKKVLKNYYTLTKLEKYNVYTKKLDELKSDKSKLSECLTSQKETILKIASELKKVKATSPYLEKQLTSSMELIPSIKIKYSNQIDILKKTNKNIVARMKEIISGSALTLSQKKEKKTQLERQIKTLNSLITTYKSKYQKAVTTRDNLQRKKFIKTSTSDMTLYSGKLKELQKEKSKLIKEIKSLDI